MTTWGIKNENKKKRHVIKHTSWNMVNGVTHDHMVPIAVYAAEWQDLRSSWSRRKAWDAINSGSRVEDEITKRMNIGRWALSELWVGFLLHLIVSFTDFFMFRLLSLSLSLSLSTVSWAYRIEMLFVSISNTSGYVPGLFFKMYFHIFMGIIVQQHVLYAYVRTNNMCLERPCRFNINILTYTIFRDRVAHSSTTL